MTEIKQPLAGKDYKIVKVRLNEEDVESSILAFEDEVRTYMDAGYETIGTLILYQPVNYTDRWFFQVVVKN